MTATIRADLTLGTVYGLAVSAIFWALLIDPPRGAESGWLLLAGAAAVGAGATAFRRGQRVLIPYAVGLVALLLSGVAISCLAGVVSVLTTRVRGYRIERWRSVSHDGFRLSREMLALAGAGVAFVFLGGAADSGVQLAPLAVHAAVYAVARTILVVLVRLGVGHPASFRHALIRNVAILPVCAASAAVAWATAVTLSQPSARPFLLAAGALLAAWAIHRMHARRESLSREHRSKRAVLRREITRALARTMEARDACTQDHLRRVHRLCLGVAKKLELSDAEIETLSAGALLHDIGKVSVPDSILNKPGRLSPQEMRRVEQHAAVGADIVSSLPFPHSLAPIVRYHHERWDGNGYPDGLEREQIPLPARILACVDCYDALTTDRPYRKALTHHDAAAFLCNESGRMFDPDVVDALLDYLQARGPECAVESRTSDETTAEEATDGEPTLAGSLARAQLELEVLYDVGRAMGYGLNLEEFLTLVGCKVSTLIPFQSLVIYFLDEETGMLRAQFSMGRASEKLRLMTIPLGERLSGWAAAQHRAVTGRDHVSPLERDGSRSDLEDWVEDPDVACLKATLAAPMVAGSGVVGVVTLYDEIGRAFSVEERRTLVRIAGCVAQVAAQETPGSTVAHTSLTDPLTGVPNARFLWLESAHRMTPEGSGFGVVTFRVGGLDTIAEDRGNEAVDRLLCEAARRFAASCQRSETLVRLGQDLFIVLTPTHVSGELIRRWHELAEEVSQPVLDRDHGVVDQIRLTAAHASYPEDGNDLEELLEVLGTRLSLAACNGRTILPFRTPRSVGATSRLSF